MGQHSPDGSRRVWHSVVAFVGRYLEPGVIRFVAMTFLVLGIVQVAIAFWTTDGYRIIFGSEAGGDYAAFYVAGTVLNEYRADRLYDIELQSELYHSILPDAPAEQELPYVNPPFFALLFRPLSLLSYIHSYVAWVLVSASLYIAGLVLLRKSLGPLLLPSLTMSLLLALSFAPFLFEATIGGNSSAFGFFFVALALYFERRGKDVASGMALGMCLYKPTWLVLILPMLAVGRKGRTLLGVAFAGLELGGVSVLTVGWEACLGYVEVLFQLSEATSVPEDVFPMWKYVDLLSFTRLLLGHPTLMTWLALISALLVPLSLLAREWWCQSGYGEDHRDLLWACTLTWTTIFNLHFGIYDTIVVVAGMILTAGVLYRCAPDPAKALSPGFRWLIGLLYLGAWISQPLARLVGFQALTVVLAAAGAYPLLLAHRCSVSFNRDESQA